MSDFTTTPAEIQAASLDDLAEVADMYSPEGDADYELRPGFLPIGEDDGGNLCNGWLRPSLASLSVPLLA